MPSNVSDFCRFTNLCRALYYEIGNGIIEAILHFKTV